jgi:Adenylate cyclase, family 3 (some proteins contain HAMP domain)
MISILKQAASKDVEKTEELLSQMLPQHVLINLEEENSVTDRLSNVTLMYADIVGFTAWSSTKTPIEVVNMLSLLFTKFDKLCLIHNVYKVHTIGDCYVIFGYITRIKKEP